MSIAEPEVNHDYKNFDISFSGENLTERISDCAEGKLEYYLNFYISSISMNLMTKSSDILIVYL